MTEPSLFPRINWDLPYCVGGRREIAPLGPQTSNRRRPTSTRHWRRRGIDDSARFFSIAGNDRCGKLCSRALRHIGGPLGVDPRHTYVRIADWTPAQPGVLKRFFRFRRWPPCAARRTLTARREVTAIRRLFYAPTFTTGFSTAVLNPEPE